MAEGQPAWNRKIHPVLSCRTCGKSFEVYAYRTDAKYCSYGCYWKCLKGKPSLRNQQVQRICVVCGKLFKVNRYRLRNAKYCSQQCHGFDSIKTMPSAHTSIERAIEHELSKENVQFEPQPIIKGICRPDFLIPECKLIIFCDGEYWHSLPKQQLRDIWQNKRLKEAGYQVLRLSEREIENNLEDCISKIQSFVV